MKTTRATAIQICGTGSGVGKSIIAAGLCRILLQDGYKVCPFKAQNMALNSFVTQEGGEIGRAQAVQALAAKVKPAVDMNPILIKPNADTDAQIVLRGKPIGNMSAMEYTSYKKKASKVVLSSLKRLQNSFNAIVIEGAGSIAEINLKKHDIVNLKMAQAAGAPVILVGDIDKGGVFAWLIGTLALLTKREKKLIKGFIINKFRGDIRLLKPGLSWLERKTGIKVVGVLPYFKDLHIPEEDSVYLSKIAHKKPEKKKKAISITVIGLPHIANFTDFDALEQEPDVQLNYIRQPEKIKFPDVIIIPGTKNTISDLHYMKKLGLDKKIIEISRHKKTKIIGICGGFQILGRTISDSPQIESANRKTEGLSLLPITTSLKKTKILSQTKGREINSGIEVSAYEIHHGKTTCLKKTRPMFKIREKNGKKQSRFEGIISPDKKIWGTYLHGIFDNDEFRRHFLNTIRKEKGWKPVAKQKTYSVDTELNKLASLLRKHLNMPLLYHILNKHV